MDEKLNYIFSNINDWLKYAEAKSATLLAGNAGLIFGASKMAKTFSVDGCLAIYCAICITLCLLSLTLCLLSFVPALKMPWESKPSGVSDDDNILYFFDIAKYTPIAYMNKLAKKLNLDNFTYSDYQKDIASQIITNSVIAKRKYMYFKIAIWLTVFAVISPIIGVVIYWFRGR